jgi:dTDP-4-amino-4,6-dideoxygalactose transaminase
MNPHLVTEQFEREIAAYCGSPHAIAIDNCSNALFLCLKYLYDSPQEITIPSHTYMSVPCSILNAGHRVKFKASPPILRGAYDLSPSPVMDSALRFTRGMYKEGKYMCLSFTGPKKILKLGKGGCVLTDDSAAAAWLKKARYNGRNPMSHLADSFDMLGWNFYMSNETAARGLVLLAGMHENEDIAQEYQDLSQYPIYSNDF